MTNYSSNLHDEITNPKHYTSGSIEPIEYITANNLCFCAGNVVKYITRYKQKDGIKDLKKAKFYIERLIKEEEKKAKNNLITLKLSK